MQMSQMSLLISQIFVATSFMARDIFSQIGSIVLAMMWMIGAFISLKIEI